MNNYKERNISSQCAFSFEARPDFLNTLLLKHNFHPQTPVQLAQWSSTCNKLEAVFVACCSHED